MTRSPLICAFAAAGHLLAGPLCASPSTVAAIAEVQAALDKGDAQHAASLSDMALKEDGVGADERGRLLLYRGLAKELLGGHAEAMRDFTQALDVHALPADERAQALLQRGFLRDGLGRLDEAVADYTAVIALKGEGLTTALNNRANIYRRQNKLLPARRDYLAALSAGGGRPQYSWYGLGQIAEAQRDTGAARGFYAKAVAADSSYGLAAERLAGLGGPLDGAIPEPARLELHPPTPAADVRPEAATRANRQTDDAIILRAPRPRSVGGAPHPASRAATPSADVHPQSTARSGPVTLVGGLILRPALDERSQPSSSTEVQLGAWRSETEANAGWSKARRDAGGALDGFTPHVVSADLPGKGRYYRLRVVPGAGHDRAGFCAGLVAKGVTCLPARD